MPMVRSRLAGWFAILFVVLLFLSAGMVTLPASTADPKMIAEFYASNRAFILISQLVGLIAIPVFLAFAFRFEDSIIGSKASGRIGVVGFAALLVGMASFVTSIPVIALALTTMGLPLWVRMTDLSDAVLFLFIGAYCVAIALQGKDAPAWLRAVAVLAGLLALARSVAGFAGTPSILDLVAPFAFIVSVIASGVYLLLTAR